MDSQKIRSPIISAILSLATIATAGGGILLLYFWIFNANLTRDGLSISDDWPLLAILTLSIAASIASWVIYNTKRNSWVAIIIAGLGAIIVPVVLLIG